MAVDVFAVAPALPGPVRSLQALDVDGQVIHGDLDRHALLQLQGRHAFAGAVGEVLLHVIRVLLHASRLRLDLLLHGLQVLDDKFERLDHGLPLHGAQRVQILEIAGHLVVAPLVLFRELLKLLHLLLQGFLLLA